VKLKMSLHPLRITASACPSCFRKLDAVDSIGEGGEFPSPPEPGDYTVCIGCFSILRFDDNLQLVLSSLSEVPVEIRSRMAFIKMTVEEAAQMWNAKGGKPWANH
jgi:hypothetical protein